MKQSKLNFENIYDWHFFSKLEIDHFFRDLTHLLFNSEVYFPFNKRNELNFRRKKNCSYQGVAPNVWLP